MLYQIAFEEPTTTKSFFSPVARIPKSVGETTLVKTPCGNFQITYLASFHDRKPLYEIRHGEIEMQWMLRNLDDLRTEMIEAIEYFLANILDPILHQAGSQGVELTQQ